MLSLAAAGRSATEAQASVHAQSLQSCLTLCHPMDYSPPGSFVYGILQARILEWVAMPSSRDQTHVSCIGRRILHRLSHLGSPYRAYWLTIEKRKIFCNTEINSCLPLKNFIPRTEVNWQSESWILSLQKELAFVPPRKLASTSPCSSWWCVFLWPVFPLYRAHVHSWRVDTGLLGLDPILGVIDVVET